MTTPAPGETAAPAISVHSELTAINEQVNELDRRATLLALRGIVELCDHYLGDTAQWLVLENSAEASYRYSLSGVFLDDGGNVDCLEFDEQTWELFSYLRDGNRCIWERMCDSDRGTPCWPYWLNVSKMRSILDECPRT